MHNSLWLLVIFLIAPLTHQPDVSTCSTDAQLEAYLAHQVRAANARIKESLENSAEWEVYRQAQQSKLREMLGLMPWPERGDLKAEVTAIETQVEFTIEKIHFQSLPELYVTANLYIPKNLSRPAPTILYLCGHASVIKDGYNYGAKAHYHHHAAWYARHGYVCLILDTVQLGEIEGTHHGTYRYDRWWWLARGYTPGGVETWNAIRALDYLSTRDEVDSNALGITGRSGGGAISWYTTALDDRIKVSVPVAGITNLADHIIEGCIEGHCDCMYPINYYQWDFGQLASLVAPRPLLISNSDRDPIFPIKGVFDVYSQVREVYEALDAGDDLALHTVAGGHHDVQEIRVHAFRWFDKYLFQRNQLIDQPARKILAPEQLRVFDVLPLNEINTTVDQHFVAQAAPISEIAGNKPWPELSKKYWDDLQTKIFRNWPRVSPNNYQLTGHQETNELILNHYEISTDSFTQLPAYLIRSKNMTKPSRIEVKIIDAGNETFWSEFISQVGHGETSGYSREIEELFNADAMLWVITARGLGPNKYTGDEVKQNHIRRRFPLIGQSLDMMQTWDILQGIRATQSIRTLVDLPINISAEGSIGALTLYASIFLNKKMNLKLAALPFSHHNGPYYPGILRYMDISSAILMASEKHDLAMVGSAAGMPHLIKEIKTAHAKDHQIPLPEFQ